MAPWTRVTWNQLGASNLAPGRAYRPFALINGERGPPDSAGLPLPGNGLATLVGHDGRFTGGSTVVACGLSSRNQREFPG